MKILVANLGSTSFKYRLFDMADERVLARGGVERIGSDKARCYVQAGDLKEEAQLAAQDHAVAVRLCLQQLSDPRLGCLKDPAELAAIGFKAVHARAVTGVQRVDDRVLSAMEAYADVAPAHNPPYIAAMRLLARELPQLPLVAAFETGFHETIPPPRKRYAVPQEWADKYGVKRWGFHGASHRYIAERTAFLLGKPDAKIISCHLGGSSSLCAIHAGQSVATSMGMSPQSGLPQNNRVGDFDVFALPMLLRETGKTLPQLLDELANHSGLQGLSGAGNDLRDIEEAAAAGNAQAQLAMEVYVEAVRHYLGAFLVHLNGADAIVFTGGIGENSAWMRSAICENLEWFGIAVDPRRNASIKGEDRFDADESQVQLWTMPTNEELIVARQAKQLLDLVPSPWWGRVRVGESIQIHLGSSPPPQPSPTRGEGVRKKGSPMFLARVTGSVIATHKVANMTGHKLLTVEPLRVDPGQRDKLVTTGRTFVVVDTVGAGQGEMVLIVQGSSARLTPETEKLPVDATIIGIVDSVNVENKTIFSARESG